MPRTILIFNPNAGQADQLRPQIDRAVDLWRNAGWAVTLAPTQYSGHGTGLAHQAAIKGYDYAIAAGGDGTVNEVMNGLLHSNTALGTIPIGTVNIWAREMGLPMDIVGAAEELLMATVKTIDVGKSFQPGQPDRAFLLMAGIGFDAAVTEIIDVQEKKKLGVVAYVKSAIQLAWQFQGFRTLLRIDGKRVRGRILMIIIGNSQLYGGMVKITANAIVDDRLLDVCVSSVYQRAQYANSSFTIVFSIHAQLQSRS